MRNGIMDDERREHTGHSPFALLEHVLDSRDDLRVGLADFLRL